MDTSILDVVLKQYFQLQNEGKISIEKTTNTNQTPNNVVNYEDVLDKRIIAGDESKSTQKLKEWLDNDPKVIAEDTI
jgi:hypothetical protein